MFVFVNLWKTWFHPNFKCMLTWSWEKDQLTSCVTWPVQVSERLRPFHLDFWVYFVPPSALFHFSGTCYSSLCPLLLTFYYFDFRCYSLSHCSLETLYCNSLSSIVKSETCLMVKITTFAPIGYSKSILSMYPNSMAHWQHILKIF